MAAAQAALPAYRLQDVRETHHPNPYWKGQPLRL